MKSAHCFLARSGAFAKPYPGKSVRYHVPSPVTISKWLIVCVFPGFFDVFATSLRLVSMLMRELFPTLLLPMTAISGCFGGGQSLTFTQLCRYRQLRTVAPLACCAVRRVRPSSASVR